MGLANFSELKLSIGDFLARSDLTSVIPDFITLAETDLNRELRHWRMENRATASVDSRFVQTPTDFLEPIRLHLESNNFPLALISAFEMQDMRRASSDTKGNPRHYAFVQGELEIFPTPDAATNLELYYYASIGSLSDSRTTNNILTHFPDLYLYGSLLHAAPYLGDDARISIWSGLYQKALSGANVQSNEAKYGGVGLTMKIRSN